MTTAEANETRSERKRKDILTSASTVFSREGFSQAGMEQIARDAGVSTATLYAHFPSKAELFRVVVESSLAGIAGRVRASADVRGDARTRLLAFANAYGEFYASSLSRSLFRMVIAERRRFPELAEHFRLRGKTELGEVAIGLIAALAAEGALKVQKASWAAGQLQGMIEHATLTFGLVAGDDAATLRPLNQVAEDAVETFLARYGVRGTGGSSSSPRPNG